MLEYSQRPTANLFLSQLPLFPQLLQQSAEDILSGLRTTGRAAASNTETDPLVDEVRDAVSCCFAWTLEAASLLVFFVRKKTVNALPGSSSAISERTADSVLKYLFYPSTRGCSEALSCL